MVPSEKVEIVPSSGIIIVVNNMTGTMVRMWPRTRHGARSVCLRRQTQILDPNKQRNGIANHTVFV